MPKPVHQQRMPKPVHQQRMPKPPVQYRKRDLSEKKTVKPQKAADAEATQLEKKQVTFAQESQSSSQQQIDMSLVVNQLSREKDKREKVFDHKERSQSWRNMDRKSKSPEPDDQRVVDRYEEEAKVVYQGRSPFMKNRKNSGGSQSPHTYNMQYLQYLHHSPNHSPKQHQQEVEGLENLKPTKGMPFWGPKK